MSLIFFVAKKTKSYFSKLINSTFQIFYIHIYHSFVYNIYAKLIRFLIIFSNNSLRSWTPSLSTIRKGTCLLFLLINFF